MDEKTTQDASAGHHWWSMVSSGTAAVVAGAAIIAAVTAVIPPLRLWVTSLLAATLEIRIWQLILLVVAAIAGAATALRWRRASGQIAVRDSGPPPAQITSGEPARTLPDVSSIQLVSPDLGIMMHLAFCDAGSISEEELDPWRHSLKLSRVRLEAAADRLVDLGLVRKNFVRTRDGRVLLVLDLTARGRAYLDLLATRGIRA